MQHEGSYASSLEEKLKQYGLTTLGAKFVVKALHPVFGPPSQVPDAIQVAALLPEYKTNTVISAPAAVVTAQSTWDALFIFPPSDVVAFYYATGNTGTDFRTTFPLSVSGVSQITGTQGANSNFVIRQNATTGLWTQTTYNTVISSDQPAMWRTASRSATVYSTGSDLYNQGTIYAGQYARIPQRLGGGVTTVNSQSTVYNQSLIAVPLSEVDMAVLTPNMYTAPVREGVYSVHRLTGPAQDFVAPEMPTTFYDSVSSPNEFCINLGASLGASPIFGTALTIPTFLEPDSLHISPLTFGVGTVAAPLGSSGFDKNTTWGVVICRGLHYLQSLTVKTDTVLEEVPLPTAPTRQYVVPACKYEPSAIAAYYALASEVPDCMAAKHNLLGSILPILSNVASKIFPFLAPLAGDALRSVASRLSPAPSTAVVLRRKTSPPQGTRKAGRVRKRVRRRRVALRK